MNNSLLKHLFCIFLLALALPAFATQHDECREFEVNYAPDDVPTEYVDALLWKVSKGDQAPSYIFGTIHVSDIRVLKIPDKVMMAINESSRFAMETIPEFGDLMRLEKLMFYEGNFKLSDHLDSNRFEQTVEILKRYNMSDEAIARMKPWAAYLTMNYPINNNMPLDMVLLEMAKQQDKEILGLENLNEQLSAFTSLDVQEQVQILLDTLCNYDLVLKGFEEMITLYVNRNLRGLYAFSLRYSFAEDEIYERLFEQLLIDRNHKMVKSMLQPLKQGNTFVAIGALHLSGQEGVLALLNRAGYRIEAVY